MNGYVLIADDNVDARQIFAEAAESMGLVVETTGDGTAALALARQKPPALLLLDVMMPGLNGLQVLSPGDRGCVLRDWDHLYLDVKMLVQLCAANCI